MTKISLEKFIEKTKGKKVDIPWATKPSSLKGQCVSLIQAYIAECLEQPAKARGNAKDWVNTYVSEGLGTIAKDLKKGDIIVWGKDYGYGYGHIAIYVDQDIVYEQNRYTHDNRCAGYGKLEGNYTILRPNATLIEDEADQRKSEETTLEYSIGNYITLEEMNIRSGAGYKYAIKKVKDMSLNGKKHATSTNPNANATYKKGTEFTAQEIIKNGKEYWAKTPSGYICLKGASNKIYCKKAK